jgi:hypothetical protein
MVSRKEKSEVPFEEADGLCFMMGGTLMLETELLR